jgi:hypothetical protein
LGSVALLKRIEAQARPRWAPTVAVPEVKVKRHWKYVRQAKATLTSYPTMAELTGAR